MRRNPFGLLGPVHGAEPWSLDNRRYDPLAPDHPPPPAGLLGAAPGLLPTIGPDGRPIVRQTELGPPGPGAPRPMKSPGTAQEPMPPPPAAGGLLGQPPAAAGEADPGGGRLGLLGRAIGAFAGGYGQAINSGNGGGALAMGAAGASGALAQDEADGRQRRFQDLQMRSYQDRADLQKQELADRRAEADRRTKLLATLPPEQRQAYELYGDKAFELIRPPEPITPYQQAQLDLRRQEIAGQGQLTPYQQAELGISRQRLALDRRKTEAEAAGQGGPFAGNGLDAQAMNLLLDVNRKIRAGGYESLSPEEKDRYGLALGQVRQPRSYFDPQAGQLVTVTPSVGDLYVPGAPAPPPQAPQAPGAPPAPDPAATQRTPDGATVTSQKVAGGRPDAPLPADAAGKIGLIKGGLEDVTAIERALFNPDSTLNKTAILATNPPGQGIPGLGGALAGGIPGTEGRSLRGQFDRAIDSLVRIKTGMAAPPAEMAGLYRQYMPDMYDDEDAARTKLGALRRDLTNAMAEFNRNRGPDGGGGAAPAAGATQPPAASAARPGGEPDYDALIDDVLGAGR